MEGNNVCILGGGWLGKPLATFLEEEGYLVALSTASKEKYDQLKTRGKKVYQIKVESHQVEGDVAAFLAGAQTLIINITPNRGALEKEQLLSLVPFIEASSIEQVLYVSSTSVYPNLNRVVFEDEGVEKKTHHLYKSEQFLRTNAHFKTTIVRMAGLVGGERHPGRFFRKSGLIKNAQAPVNLIHRKDCLQIIAQILQQNAWGEIFNGCSDHHPSKEHFYPIAAQSIGMDIPICQRAEEPFFKIISNKKVKEQLGITFQCPDLLALIQNDEWV